MNEGSGWTEITVIIIIINEACEITVVIITEEACQ